MIKEQVSVTINRPVEQVFAYVSNFENNSQWQAGVIETQKMSAGPNRIGATHTYVRQILGRRIEATSETTEYVPNRKVAFKAASGPLKFEAADLFEPSGSATKVTFAYEAEVGGLFKLA